MVPVRTWRELRRFHSMESPSNRHDNRFLCNGKKKKKKKNNYFCLWNLNLCVRRKGEWKRKIINTYLSTFFFQCKKFTFVHMFSFVHISIIFRSWIIIELFFFYRNFYKLSRIRCKCWSVDRTDGVFGNVEFVRS